MSKGYPSDWETRRKQVYRRDDHTCQNCGSRGGTKGDMELHAHHVVPKSQGGTHATSNLITLCKDCHNTVHSNSKQAPTANTPAQSDYGTLSDDIINESTRIAEYALNNLMFAQEDTIEHQAAQFNSVANEIRPNIMDVTNAVDELNNVSTTRYPDELVIHDKKMINMILELLKQILDTVEYGGKEGDRIVNNLRFCPECDTEIPEKDQSFCMACGAELKIGPKCPSCNEEVLPTKNFCPSCGESLGDIQDERGIATDTENVEKELNRMLEEIIQMVEDLTKMSEQRNRLINKYSN